MILLTLIVILNVAALNIYILMVNRFGPQRHSSFLNASYWWMMWAIGAYHGLVATLACYELVTGGPMPNNELYSDSFHRLLAPFLVTTVLMDYNLPPSKPNLLARVLVWIPEHARGVYFSVLLLSLCTIITKLLTGDNFLLNTFRLISIDGLLASFGAIWLLMEFSGLRAASDTYGGKSKLVRAHRVILFLILAVFIFDYQGYGVDDSVIALALPFLTLPMVFRMGWRQYRLVFIDVIVRKLVQLTLVVAGSITTLWCISRVPPDTVPLVVIQGVIIIVYAVMQANKHLDNLWLPGKVTRESFNRDFPADLVSCLTPAAAIKKTEETIARLFKAEVRVNDELEDQATRVGNERDPSLYISLGYVRGLYPWFPDALNLVQDATTRLSSHLQLLELQKSEYLQVLRNQQLEELTAKAELAALRSQIRPHFLFNVLNTIHSFIVTEPHRAERTLELLAELMRGIVIEGDQDFHSLAREIELAETYLKIEEIRFGERLTFSIDIDASLQEQLVPVFSIQPLVENAVKYSVEKTLNHGIVELRASKAVKGFQITVDDNGPGLGTTLNSDGSGLGIALKNISDRLEKHYGDDGALTLEKSTLGGMRARLTLPLVAHGNNDNEIKRTAG